MAAKKGGAKKTGRDATRRAVGATRSRKTASHSKPARKSASTRGHSAVVILDASARPSPLAVRAASAFRAGVDDALGQLAAAGIPVTVKVNGETVRGVPVRRDGKYVIETITRRVAEPRRSR